MRTKNGVLNKSWDDSSFLGPSCVLLTTAPRNICRVKIAGKKTALLLFFLLRFGRYLRFYSFSRYCATCMYVLCQVHHNLGVNNFRLTHISIQELTATYVNQLCSARNITHSKSFEEPIYATRWHHKKPRALYNQNWRLLTTAVPYCRGRDYETERSTARKPGKRTDGGRGGGGGHRQTPSLPPSLSPSLSL